MVPCVKIVYFSGTGCTAICAEKLMRSFCASEIPVSIHKTGTSDDVLQAVRDELLIIMYPVHSFDAPQPIYDYIKRLDSTCEEPAAVVAVSGGGEITPNRACRLNVCNLLEAKGYSVVYESMLVMPCNFLIPTPTKISVALLEVLDHKCNMIALDLIRGAIYRTHPPLIDRLFSKLARFEKGYYGRTRFGESIKVGDSCVSCGWCSDSCPSGNITMHRGKPRFGLHCNMCLKCIYGCPKKALSATYGSFFVLKEGFSLEGIETSSMKSDPTALDDIKGPLWKGVRKYLAQ